MNFASEVDAAGEAEAFVPKTQSKIQMGVW
jgi:hypothetical protein